MTPLECYQAKLKTAEIFDDPEQRNVMQLLDTIYNRLIKRQAIRNSKLGKLCRKIKPRKPIPGLYLWGNIGTGKTLMIDIFFHCLPVKKKRLHFHAFMRQVHSSLKRAQGHKNPLQFIAKQIAEEVLVICFDEFFVSDIVDAMILKELFTALFKGGVCLITTSNIPPDDLYKNGIRREQFLPAINIIKKNVKVIHLKSKQDYRLHPTATTKLYYTPLNRSAEEKLTRCFQHYSANARASTEPIQVANRPIEIIKRAEKIIWFDFYKICGRPRSTNDYLVLIKQYQTFLISNLPMFDNQTPDLLLSFIYLIDVLYDAHKRIILSAAAPIEQLYHGKKFKMAFKRTQSRLVDMQSTDYLIKVI